MDSICVQALIMCSDCKMLESEVLAPQEMSMKVLAVRGRYIVDYSVGDEIELQTLVDQANKNDTKLRNLIFLFDHLLTP